MIIYNTGETALQQYNGGWTTITPAPSVTSTSGTINEDTNATITVNGAQFVSGMTIKLVVASSGADIVGHTALSYTLVSASQITVTVPSATTALTPGLVVQIQVIKSGLAANSGSLTVSEDPNWTTAAGTLATVSDALGVGQTVGTLVAAAGAGGGTLVYSSDDSTFDTSYFVLNSSTGVVTTHASTAIAALASSGNYTESFNANAAISGDATKNTVRAFNIIVRKDPTGGAITTSADGNYRIHTFYNAGNGSATNVFTTSIAYEIDFLIVGGGGSGAAGNGGCGGGGAGGFRQITITPVVGSYTIVIGAGGTSVASSGTNGNTGGASTAFGYSAAGGGYGAGWGNQQGGSGGSGGGGGGSTGTGGAGNTPSTSPVQGYAGGNGRTSSLPYSGGGGGGAGEVGQTAPTDELAAGGDGLASVYSGSSVFYAGGGGAGTEAYATSTNNGGNGGGGQGGRTSYVGVAGTPNTGGGGGGGGYHFAYMASGAGGTGIVIVRYAA